jgi:hypothetical protein
MSKEILIDVGDDLSADLERDFQSGFIIVGPRTLGDLVLKDGEEVRYAAEAKAGEIGGLKIEIFAKEHPPPHFRVIYNGETANFTIKDCTRLNGGLDIYFHNIRKWHSKNKQKLIDKWNEMRPSDCTVGRYIEGA